jgi:DNA polymerase elongation subunit (family B)
MDIETVGAYPDLPTCEKENPSLAKLFRKNYKWFENKYPEDAGVDENHMFINRTALVPEFAKVIAIAYGVTDTKGDFITQSIYNHNEKELLKKANDVFDRVEKKGLVICGHSVKSFDIPFLAKRMIINGMNPHPIFPKHDTKPWDVSMIDTKEIWQYGTYIGISTLESVCVSLGIESPKSDELYGASIHKVYWVDNKLEEISEYCKRDVNVLPEIVKKLQNLI